MMAGAEGVTLQSVIRRLDILDGTVDNKYKHMQLTQGVNTTGICEVVERVKEFTKNSTVAGTPIIDTFLENESGTIPVDCKAVIQRLNLLAGIAQKMPMFDIYIANGIIPTPAQTFAGDIVDSMIVATLRGEVPADLSLDKLFDSVRFSFYTQEVRDMGQELRNVLGEGGNEIAKVYSTFQADNRAAALSVFEKLGREQGVNISAFRRSTDAPVAPAQQKVDPQGI